jgi:hypothetical protein
MPKTKLSPRTTIHPKPAQMHKVVWFQSVSTLCVYSVVYLVLCLLAILGLLVSQVNWLATWVQGALKEIFLRVLKLAGEEFCKCAGLFSSFRFIPPILNDTNVQCRPFDPSPNYASQSCLRVSLVIPSPEFTMKKLPRPQLQHSHPQRSSSRLASRSVPIPSVKFHRQLNGVERFNGHTHCPFGESQFHFPSSFGCQSLIIFQASSDDSCGDREVFVVAIEKLVSTISFGRLWLPNVVWWKAKRTWDPKLSTRMPLCMLVERGQWIDVTVVEGVELRNWGSGTILRPKAQDTNCHHHVTIIASLCAAGCMYRLRHKIRVDQNKTL